MRIIYLNNELTRIEDGCGLRPFKKCPLQVWAMGEKYTVHRETTLFPLQTKINIVGMMESNKVSLAIAKICDGCFFGACHDIKSRSK